MKRRRASPLKPQIVMVTVAIAVTCALAGIGYVWAKTEVWSLSREKKKLEVRLDVLKRANAASDREYARMCTPRALAEQVRRLNLGLAAPQPDQIIRVPEPVVAAPGPVRETILTAQADSGLIN